MKKCFKFKKLKTTVWFSIVFCCFVSLPLFAQQTAKVTGKVIDSDGEPIIGVTVKVKDIPTKGALSDMEGKFSIDEVPVGAMLDFTFIGYVQAERKFEGKELTVIMLENNNELEEVTVVAFGTQKKESVLASITTISPSQLKMPSSNLTAAFAGQLAGMISYQTTGEPGADNATFFIRGVTTFGYNVDPLILVDNIEISKSELARIQPDDIESFSIMKDAAATALYGARGANGVILIKTKEGTVGKAQLSIRVENTFSKPTREIELADPITYMKMHNEARITRNKALPPIYSDDKIERTVPGSGSYIYPATDWRNELLKNFAANQRVNMSVKGGGAIARYYVSASLSQDNGILKVDHNNNFNNNIDLKIYTLRSNVNIDLTKTTEFKVSVDGTFEDYSGPLGSGSDMYALIMRSNPVLFPAKYPIDADHTYIKHTMFGNAEDENGSLYLNPYAQMVRGYREYNKSIMGSQVEMNQKLDFITKGLFVRALFNTKREALSQISRSYDPYYYRLTSYNQYTGEYHVGIINPDSNGENLTSSITLPDVVNTTYFETAVNYSGNFAEMHNAGAQLVYTMRNKTIPPLTATTSSVMGSLPYRNVGLAGRFSYGYQGKYLGEFNFGYNGSERFSEAHRWGFFPSISAGWLISNEKFFQSLKNTVSLLKLRGSYGLAGNDDISSDRFLYLSNVNLSSTSNVWNFGYEQGGYGRPGVSVSRYAAPDITWEVAYKTNLALELNVKELNVVAEYFRENRSNILQTRASIPYSMGLWAPENVKANLGKARSKGTDLAFTYNKSFNKDLWLQARLNYTYAVSEYVQYEEMDYQTEYWKLHKGNSTTQIYGYIAEGLFIDDTEIANSPVQFGGYMAGDIKYRDLNGDGVINDRDMAPIGYPTTPEIQYGFGASMGWKSWDFSFFFNGLHNRSFFINYNNMSPFFSTSYSGNSLLFYGNNALAKFIADNYWSEDNRNPYAVWPRLATSSSLGLNNSYTNTWFMRDGAFLRLKSVELGYTLPESLVKKLRMASLKLYVTSTNSLCFSKFKLWDPEMVKDGYGNGLGYPLQKTFNLGILVNF